MTAMIVTHRETGLVLVRWAKHNHPQAFARRDQGWVQSDPSWVDSLTEPAFMGCAYHAEGILHTMTGFALLRNI